jgi:hypothetical protein
MLALPFPEQGGSIEGLLPFLTNPAKTISCWSSTARALDGQKIRALSRGDYAVRRPPFARWILKYVSVGNTDNPAELWAVIDGTAHEIRITRSEFELWHEFPQPLD